MDRLYLVDLTKENVGRVVDVPNAINITLTGTPVTNAQVLAVVPPVAPGPGEAPGNTFLTALILTI
ncbi:hypothetical protein [Rickettsia peacockii]|uniref:hypothetical protein n=1 Tax=Rickettsia peacockii TaxID=47589 RepID=UPI0002F2379A|nr:hypothetical protein [Rickettsia peacockii]